MKVTHSDQQERDEEKQKDIIDDSVEKRLRAIEDDQSAVESSSSDDQIIKAEDQRRNLFGIAFAIVFVIIISLYIALLFWLFCSKDLDWHVFTVGVTALVVPSSTLSIVLVKSLSKRDPSKETDIAVSIGLKAILDAIKEVASIFKK